METKNKVLKTAKVCGIAAKVLYLLSIAACVTFVVLAIVLSNTDTITSYTKAETAMIFSTLAIYSFVLIGLMWNVEGIFKSIVSEGSPFAERVCHYVKKVAVFVIILSVVPALIGSIILRSIYPETDVSFPIDVGGIIAGVVFFVVGLVFNYGRELQKRDDETL